MKEILIHCAMNKEAAIIAEGLGLTYIENNIYSGIIKNTNVKLVVSGTGKQRTAIKLTQYLENNVKPQIIINIGYAGSTNTEIGKWVNVNKSYNLEWNIPGEEKYTMKIGNIELEKLPELKSVACYSAECFVTETDIEEDVIFDMELHSVCLIADIYKIPLVSIKQVSDNLSLTNYYDNIENIIDLKDGIKYIEKYID